MEYNIFNAIVQICFVAPIYWGEMKGEIMAKTKRIHDTKEIMREREQYPEREKKERPTGQDLQSGSNGKRFPGGRPRKDGPRGEGKKR